MVTLSHVLFDNDNTSMIINNGNQFELSDIENNMKSTFASVIRSILLQRVNSTKLSNTCDESVSIVWLDQSVVIDQLYYLLTQSSTSSTSNSSNNNTNLNIHQYDEVNTNKLPYLETYSLHVTVTNAEKLLVNVIDNILNQIDETLKGSSLLSSTSLTPSTDSSSPNLSNNVVSCDLSPPWISTHLHLRHYPILFSPSTACTTCEQLLANTSMVIGFHPDQATEIIINEALNKSIPFAVVPCCVFPNMSPNRIGIDGKLVRSFEQFIDYLQAKDIRIRKVVLENVWGPNNIVLYMTLKDFQVSSNNH